MVVQLAETQLITKFGTYKKILFYDGQKESIALVMGKIEGTENVLCRIHSACISAHAFNSIECDCREQMAMSQQIIEKEGVGIIIWLEQEGKGNGHFALMQSMTYKKSGMSQADAYEAVGFKRDARDFAQAAAILKTLGVKSRSRGARAASFPGYCTQPRTATRSRSRLSPSEVRQIGSSIVFAAVEVAVERRTGGAFEARVAQARGQLAEIFPERGLLRGESFRL